MRSGLVTWAPPQVTSSPATRQSKDTTLASSRSAKQLCRFYLKTAQVASCSAGENLTAAAAPREQETVRWTTASGTKRPAPKASSRWEI